MNKIRKNSLVKINAGSPCWRDITDEWADKWQREYGGKYGEDGELLLQPKSIYYAPNFDGTFIVLKARLRARLNFRYVANCVHLVCPVTGVQFYVRKVHIKLL